MQETQNLKLKTYDFGVDDTDAFVNGVAGSVDSNMHIIDKAITNKVKLNNESLSNVNFISNGDTIESIEHTGTEGNRKYLPFTDKKLQEKVSKINNDIVNLNKAVYGFDSTTIEVDKRKKVAVGVLDSGSEHVCWLYTASTSYVTTYLVELKRGQKVNISIDDITRCRIIKTLKPIKDLIIAAGSGHTAESSFSLKNVIKNDDELTQYTFAYECTTDYDTLAIYVGGTEEKEPTINVSIVLPERFEDEKLIDGLIHEFTPFPVDYSASKSNPKVLDISVSTFLSTFYEPYLGHHNNGYRVTKRVLGKDQSNTHEIFQYDFCPKDYKKTILLSSGLHAYETPASFGLARWIQGLMAEESDALKWLKENVRIKVIPILNPWGFSQNPKTYGNCNGVNPNRNFDTFKKVWDSFPVYSATPGAPNYDEWNVKGEAPFSEAETRIIRDWLYENDNADFWIDCHIGLFCYYGENWIIYQSTNPNISRIKKALSALEERISTKYGKKPVSYVQVDLQSSIKVAFANDDVGVPCLVIEQSQGNNSYGTSVNNEPIKITEYATTLNAYVISQLI